MLSEFGDRAGGNTLLCNDDLPNTASHIREGCICLWCLVHGDDQVGYEMGRNLHVGLHEGSEESQHGLERGAGYQRGVRDGIDVREEITFHFRVCVLGREI